MDVGRGSKSKAGSDGKADSEISLMYIGGQAKDNGSESESDGGVQLVERIKSRTEQQPTTALFTYAFGPERILDLSWSVGTNSLILFESWLPRGLFL